MAARSPQHTPASALASPDATTYAHFLFNAFDADGNGAICFEVGLCCTLPDALQLAQCPSALVPHRRAIQRVRLVPQGMGGLCLADPGPNYEFSGIGFCCLATLFPALSSSPALLSPGSYCWHPEAAVTQGEFASEKEARLPSDILAGSGVSGTQPHDSPLCRKQTEHLA